MPGWLQAAAVMEGAMTEHMARDRTTNVKTFHVWIAVRKLLACHLQSADGCDGFYALSALTLRKWCRRQIIRSGDAPDTVLTHFMCAAASLSSCTKVYASVACQHDGFLQRMVYTEFLYSPDE